MNGSLAGVIIHELYEKTMNCAAGPAHRSVVVLPRSRSPWPRAVEGAAGDSIMTGPPTCSD
jgi:hypothetical protein